MTTLHWCNHCARWCHTPDHECPPPQRKRDDMTTTPTAPTTWKITWWYADPDDPDHDRCHTRTVLAGPPNRSGYTENHTVDAVPDPLVTWARQIGDTYPELTSISYAITDLLDLTDPQRDHVGWVLPGYQTIYTIHEDTYAS